MWGAALIERASPEKEANRPSGRRRKAAIRGRGERLAAPPAPEAFAPSTESDAALVTGCLERVPGAWEALVARYKRLVCSVPLKMGLHGHEADEVFQESFLALFEKLGTLKDRDRVGVWLAVTARRKALNRLSRDPGRRERAVAGQIDAGITRDPLAALVDLERQNAIRLAFAELQPGCRELLGALYYEDPPPSYRALAARLGWPLGSLGPRRLRCLLELRRLVDRRRP